MQDICPRINQCHTTILLKTLPKKWIQNLNIEALNWDDKTWEKNLKGTTLKELNHGCGEEI